MTNDIHKLWYEYKEINQEFINNNFPVIGKEITYNNEKYIIAYISKQDNIVLVNYKEHNESIRKVVLDFKDYIEQIYNMNMITQLINSIISTNVFEKI